MPRFPVAIEDTILDYLPDMEWIRNDMAKYPSRQNLEKINRDRQINPAAIDLMMNNPEKIDWAWLSENNRDLFEGPRKMPDRIISPAVVNDLPDPFLSSYDHLFQDDEIKISCGNKIIYIPVETLHENNDTVEIFRYVHLCISGSATKYYTDRWHDVLMRNMYLLDKEKIRMFL